MKKCESDAKKTCDTSAAEKKLNGAAKASFTKKCVTRRGRHAETTDKISAVQ